MSQTNSAFDLVISGVGGQGAVLVSDIIGKSAVKEGISVRAAETHGMAQRGGSVINHVRIGCELGSLIPCGKAHGMLSLEPAETLRYIADVAEGGIVVMNTCAIYPVTVASGVCGYCDVQSIVAELEKKYNVIAFDGTSLAIQAGSIKALNVVMLGAISRYLPFSEETILESIRSMVPPKTIDVNLKAFRLGREATEE
ncbi:indolepyruvate ferredoxin oxidoreductase beta subunit [Methanohalophilus levihalophilus]|uniref:indolepyruvate oxidoreductase subunit beta n=1 Tax=Methanohalophilus levihalophilus TaxID=1431282 RepID=UPI001AEB1FCF|nr:indolepyruvate oxidoreductase subunit beta [Methanohalophilus levihalophilus]MBP2030496.1 indolepyruvate ferredoxin oxidoreductase beta subunit [Methanohalophilus levihalophilus]